MPVMDRVRGRVVALLACLLLATGCDPGAVRALGGEAPRAGADRQDRGQHPRQDHGQRDRPARVVAPPRGRVDVPVTRAVRMLRRAPERSAGYERDAFAHWTDADGDGCDTRDEVLLDESLRPRRTRAGEDCRITGGAWRSAYDGERTRDPSTFDVDHVVPLADAWGSGARAWTDARRERFANDLGDPRSLVAVTASSNRSKSDRDPAEWLPDLARCRYVRDWVAVKVRWDLAADATERSVLTRRARGCGGRVVVRVAR
ncbi:hypothetical protein GCM10009737_22780 [Nocardioides lentus]|uniref:GmrSD restriction endonucleases C-terminal domain-containing protein n=2 Tax=Nocardioides lentus TaxID=338077 RepID=A0ABP5ATK8_9ACTN